MWLNFYIFVFSINYYLINLILSVHSLPPFKIFNVQTDILQCIAYMLRVQSIMGACDGTQSSDKCINPSHASHSLLVKSCLSISPAFLIILYRLSSHCAAVGQKFNLLPFNQLFPWHYQSLNSLTLGSSSLLSTSRNLNI